jgi:hypothetical protein
VWRVLIFSTDRTIAAAFAYYSGEEFYAMYFSEGLSGRIHGRSELSSRLLTIHSRKI